MEYYDEPAKKLPVSEYDVVVAGGGTAGVMAATAAARRGAHTALIEIKGYVGGLVVEGGTALHSYYNLWKAFPGVEKRQVVKGIPLEIIDRLSAVGGTTGHSEMTAGFDYDSVCTAIDTELYKVAAFEMLTEAGVDVKVNTLLAGAVVDGSRVEGVITESRSGREMFRAHSFIDCTGYADLCGFAGAKYSEPNDYPVANSIGVGGVSLEEYHRFMESHGALKESARGPRSGERDKIVRVGGNTDKLPVDFVKEANAIGMMTVTSSVHDDYFMFIKLNYKMSVSPTNRDAAAKAEIELRHRQQKAVELLRKHIPGCGKAFITRTSPSLCIRRGRLVSCDYDISLDDVLEGRHFDDDVMAYGFHDFAPRLQIKGGRTYGIPYRALLITGFDNLFAAGMMITSDHDAHMSTRNTVCCMGQGQAAGTAAALCSAQRCGSRELSYTSLRAALEEDGVYFE